MGSQLFYVSGTSAPPVDPSELVAAPAAFGGIVVNETWSQLEPTSGVEDWSDLDSSLATVTSWNTAHPSDPLGVKLRVFGGFTAPTWAKSIDGAPMVVGRRSIGRWWTPQYRQAWSTFEHALAARYDTDPLVRAVAVTSCASLTGEPFVMALTRSTIPLLAAAGWTPTLQEDCLNGILSDYSGWVHTPIDVPFNTFRTVVDGHPRSDFAVTEQLMSSCARSASGGGPTCVLGNHGLQDQAETATGPAPVYSEIDAQWQQTQGRAQVYFQTDGPTKGADCASMNIAISHHADSVEIWPQAIAATPASTLLGWDAALVGDKPLAC